MDNKNALPFIKIRIQGETLDCLLDSGSQITLAREDIFNRINSPVIPANILISTANQSMMRCDKIKYVDLEIGNGKLSNCRIICAPQMSHPLLLGQDNIRRTLSIDKCTRQVSIDECTTELCDQHNTTVLAVTEDAVLEPFSVNLILAHHPIDANEIITNPYVIIEEPESGFVFENQLLIEEGLLDNSQYLSVKIANPYPERIVIPQGTEIARTALVKNDSGIMETNELVMIKDTEAEERAFLEHQELRRRKFNPEGQQVRVEYGELPGNERHMMEELVNRHKMAFSTCPADIGLIKGWEFAIRWHDENETSYQHPRPIQPAYRTSADKVLTQWKEMNIVEPTSSENNIPLFFRKKKTGECRQILDCRDINARTIKDRYPLPHQTALLKQVGEEIAAGPKEDVRISTMDISQAYPHLRIREQDRKKVAFSYKNEHYQAARVMFGLSNGPACWSRLMNLVTKDLPGVHCMLDDIIVISHGIRAHIRVLEKLFGRLRNIGMTLKPQKTHLGISSCEYLGFQLSKNGIKPLNCKIKAITEYPRPKTRKELRRFIGLVVFYLRNIPKAMAIMSPLTKMTGGKPGEPFRWRTEQQQAFDDLKAAIKQSVELVHRDMLKELVIICDASAIGIGGSLHQAGKEGLEPLGFFSRALSDAEKKLPSRYSELIAIITTLEYFNYDVIGQKVKIINDHKSLERVLEERKVNEGDQRS